jgi:hypothetical protein
LLYRSKVVKAKFDNNLITISLEHLFDSFTFRWGKKGRGWLEKTTLNYAQYGVKESDGGYFSPIAPYVKESPSRQQATRFEALSVTRRLTIFCSLDYFLARQHICLKRRLNVGLARPESTQSLCHSDISFTIRLTIHSTTGTVTAFPIILYLEESA